jgi:hypothetical protein
VNLPPFPSFPDFSSYYSRLPSEQTESTTKLQPLPILMIMDKYANSSSNVPPPAQHQQPIQPYSNPSGNAIAPALRPLRPMDPSIPLHAQHPMHQQMQGGMESPYGQQGPAHEEVPTHVVGSQGRRGILPSAPGRPSVAATGPGASKNAPIPTKDADGKFPCPHCVKTYLHAKHLKRHLLRRKFPSQNVLHLFD